MSLSKASEPEQGSPIYNGSGVPTRTVLAINTHLDIDLAVSSVFSTPSVPNMFLILLFASLAFVSQSQHAVYHPGYHPRAVYVNPVVAPVRYTAPAGKMEDESPKPYSYSYEAPAEGGASSRQETSDGSGRVTGSYTLADEDGRSRVVEYFADETGFHANVRTNEPGTASQSPADVVVESTAHEAPPSVYAKPAPVVPAVDTRIVAPAPLAYNIAPVNRALYYSPLTHRHGLYDNRQGLYDNRHGLYDNYHGLYNRGLYSPHGLYGHNHGVYGGHYGNHGIYGHNRGYYPRYYY